MRYEAEKAVFSQQLKAFAATLDAFIAAKNEWTIRGFIDIFRNIYTISADTKIVSKILELHLFLIFLLLRKKRDMILNLPPIKTGILI